MKSLENFGVQEMSTKEMKETEGGFVICLAIVGLYIGAASLALASFTVGWMIGTALAERDNK